MKPLKESPFLNKDFRNLIPGPGVLWAQQFQLQSGKLT